MKFRRENKNIYQGISVYYDGMNYLRQNNTFQLEEDPFDKNAQGTIFIMHDILNLMKFIQNKPQVKSENIIFYDLYNTVIGNLTEEEKNQVS